jgi:hypothetical protein
MVPAPITPARSIAIAKFLKKNRKREPKSLPPGKIFKRETYFECARATFFGVGIDFQFIRRSISSYAAAFAASASTTDTFCIRSGGRP